MPLAALDGRLLAGGTYLLAASVLAAALSALPLGSTSRRARLSGPVRALAAFGALALGAVGALGLAGVTPPPLYAWPGLPGDPCTLGVDPLSAPFVLLFGVIAAAAFAVHRPAAESATGGGRGRLGLQAALGLALAGVLLAQHALLFLFAWEGAILLSAALMAHDGSSARGRRAAFVRLALSHAGTAALALGVLRLAAAAGSFSFLDLAVGYARLSPPEASQVAWLVTAGCAIELALVPLHAWLPLAHAEAPAPVSALVSGVAVSAGLYGLLRFAWQLAGVPVAGWGATLVVLGAVGAVVASLHMVAEPGSARLLAWSTIRHSGLLAAAVGLAAMFARSGAVALAGLALAACLYHVVGHGLSKGLAILAVGEAAAGAGSGDLDRMGGLARRMPRLSATALVSVLSLAGLPLLACFAGEWLLLQAVLRGFDAGPGSLRLLAPLAGAGIALATALSVAALVKLYGVGFLGRARTAGAEAAHEPPARVLRTLGGLSALVALWGIAAPWAVTTLARPIDAVVPGAAEAASLGRSTGLTLAPLPPGASSVSPPSVALLVALFAAMLFAWATLRGVRGPVRRAPTWTGGAAPGPGAQPSAAGLAAPLAAVFRDLLGARRDAATADATTPSPVRPGPRDQSPPATPRPLAAAVLWGSEQVRRVQAAGPGLLFAAVLATLVALLVWAR